MLRLLTLASVAGFASAAVCSTITCTDALTAGGASGQTQATGTNTLNCGPSPFCATNVACADTDRQRCCANADALKYIKADGALGTKEILTACVGKNLDGTDRAVPATDTTPGSCTACTGTTDFGPDSGATDCVATISTCTGKKVDGYCTSCCHGCYC